MTVPQPPVSSGAEVTAEAKAVLQEPAFSGNIEAPLDASIPGEFDVSMAEAHGWQQAGASMMDSAAGYGSAGYTVIQPDLDNDSDWPMDPSFPHQGP